MNYSYLLSYSNLGLILCGVVLFYLLNRYSIYLSIRSTKDEVNDIIQDAKAYEEELMEQKKSFAEDFKEESFEEFDKKIQVQLSKIEDLRQKIDEKKQEINTFSKKRSFFFQKDERRNQSLKSTVENKQKSLSQVKEKKTMLWIVTNQNSLKKPVQTKKN